MIIIIEKWYKRMLAFLLFQLLALSICFGFTWLNNPIVLWIWILVGLVGIVYIGKGARQTIQRIGTRRFLVSLISMLPACYIFWAFIFGVYEFFYTGPDLEVAVFVFFLSPLLAFWTLASLITLAIWPFTPKSRKPSKRWNKIVSFIVYGPSKYNKKPT